MKRNLGLLDTPFTECLKDLNISRKGYDKNPFIVCKIFGDIHQWEIEMKKCFNTENNGQFARCSEYFDSYYEDISSKMWELDIRDKYIKIEKSVTA